MCENHHYCCCCVWQNLDVCCGGECAACAEKGLANLQIIANTHRTIERPYNTTMAKDDEDDLLPDKDAAKGFYAKYEPKEILGR